MKDDVTLEILPEKDFLGITLADSDRAISIEIDDIDHLNTLKDAINLVIKNKLQVG